MADRGGAKLDGWWESHVDPDRSALADGDSLVLDTRWIDGQWASIDDWWTSHISTDRSALIDDTAITLDDRSLDDGWSDLDDWWTTYSEARQEDVKELLAALDMADETWAAGPSRFDADPLSADWQTAQGSKGPIRLGREEDWSYGLAYLLQSGSEVLIDELFRTAHEETLDNVETEAHLPGGSETTRYGDILISYPGGGISIEVKIGEYERAGISPTLERIGGYEGPEYPLDELTARQREVIETAWEMGYYEVPKEVSADDIAAEIDLDSSAVNEHLQRAERNLLGQIL